jgi:hypothetical protein
MLKTYQLINYYGHWNITNLIDIHNYLTCLLYILQMGQTACCQPNDDINMQYYNNRIINPLDSKSVLNGDKYTPIQKTLKLH